MFIPLHDTNPLKHIKLQYVTFSIIAINVLVWLITGTPAIMDDQAIKATIYSYGFIPAVVNGYETLPIEINALPSIATYLSYSFLHGDFMHLAGNMLFIWVFGDNVEDAMGHVKYLLFYLACAAAGALAHSLMGPQSLSPLIGASGAVAGIIGAYLLLHPNVKVWVLALGRIPLKIPAVFVLGFWIALQFFQIVTATDSNVSFAAHIGGIIAGIALITVLKRPEIKLFDGKFSSKPAPATRQSQTHVEPTPTRHKKPRRLEPKTQKSKTTRTSVPSAGSKSNPTKWGLD